MKLVECARHGCEEVNYLHQQVGVQRIVTFLEDGWQQVSADEFMCPECLVLVVREHRGEC